MGGNSAVVYPPSVWYDPLQKDKGDHMQNTDVLGQLIKPGDVCGFTSRRRSQTNLEVVIIRSLEADGIRADKIIKEWKHATATTPAGWHVKLVPTHKILVSDHLIITGLTEQEAIGLMRIRKEH